MNYWHVLHKSAFVLQHNRPQHYFLWSNVYKLDQTVIIFSNHKSVGQINIINLQPRLGLRPHSLVFELCHTPFV